MGVLQKCIAWILKRERPIRPAWSAERLTDFGRSGRQREQEEGGAVVVVPAPQQGPSLPRLLRLLRKH